MIAALRSSLTDIAAQIKRVEYLRTHRWPFLQLFANEVWITKPRSSVTVSARLLHKTFFLLIKICNIGNRIITVNGYSKDSIVKLKTLGIFLLFLYQFIKFKIKSTIVRAMRRCRRIDVHMCVVALPRGILPQLIIPALLILARMKAVKRIITKSSIPPRGAQRRRHPLAPLPPVLLSLTSQVSLCFYTNPAPDDIKPRN